MDLHLALRLGLSLVAAIAVPFGLAGCGGKEGAHDHAHHGHDHDHEHGHGHDHDHAHEAESGGSESDGHAGHHHAAPHGGTLIALGDHLAHVELVLDKETGGLVAYVLDGEAEKGVRIAQPTLVVKATVGEGDAATVAEVTLAGVASDLTGETAGDTSQFQGAHDALKGVERFAGELAAISVKGQELAGVAFKFPEGNE